MKTFVRRLTHSWNLVRSVELPDFVELKGMEYSHPQLGVELFQILNTNDTNSCFVPFFKTVPYDDTGRFHIIEHCTLSGPTKKYPVENLFFKMCKKSLHTYMNAWTSNLWTAYPFSSKNEKDFSNLLDVYLECLFFPELPTIRMEQEGVSIVTDPISGSFKFGGVVMNEMKGMVSDPSTFSSFAVNRNLYKGTCYQFNHGGDPLNIPELLLSKNYEDLRETFLKFYHPSNTKFVLYGNQENIDDILEYIEEKISQIPGVDESGLVVENEDFSCHVLPSRSSSPIEVYGPPQFTENNNHDTFYSSYLCCEDGDTFDSLALSFLSSVFFDRPRGIFYEKLVKPGLVTNFTTDTGFDRLKKKTSFHFGLEGFGEDEGIIEDILMELGENGVKDSDFLESLIHQMRLGWKVIDWNEFGLNLATNVVHDWSSSGDCPERSFNYLEMIDRLEEMVQESNRSFFSEYIQKYFLENDQMQRVRIIPDSEFFEKMSSEEEKVLESVSSAAPHLFVKDLGKDDQQQQPRNDDDEHHLPSLSLSRDIPPHPSSTFPDLGLPIIRDGRKEELFFNPYPSNGVVHLSVQKELDLLHGQEFVTELMKYFIGIIETLSHDSHTLKNEIQKRTSGMSGNTISFKVSQKNRNTSLFDLSPYFFLETCCLSENVIPMLELQREVMSESLFINKNKERTIDPEKKSFIISSLEKKRHLVLNKLLVRGNRYASLLSKSRLFPLYDSREKMSGLHFIRDLMNLLDEFSVALESNEQEEHILSLVETFQRIYDDMLVHSSGKIRYIITSDEEFLNQRSQELEDFIFGSSSESGEIHKKEEEVGGVYSSNPPPEDKYNTLDPLFVDIQSMVNYCAYSYPTEVIRGDEDYIPLKVLSKLIRSNYLLPSIREEGGAYGANANLDSGVFCLSSYRDPNVGRTIEVFDGIKDFVFGVNKDDQLVKEAKIEVFRDLDQVVQNGHVLTYPSLLRDWNMEDEKKEREALFDVSLEDVQDVCQKYIVGDKVSCVVLGGSGGENEDGFEFRKLVDL